MQQHTPMEKTGPRPYFRRYAVPDPVQKAKMFTVNKLRIGFALVTVFSLLFTSAVPRAFAVQPENPGNSGAIWTTNSDCSEDTQDENHYSVGDVVFINGENFDSEEEYDWDITGQPGQASSDPGVAVAEGSYVGNDMDGNPIQIDEDGSFCFPAYEIQEGDAGEYQATFGNKHDNYRVGAVAGCDTEKEDCDPDPCDEQAPDSITSTDEISAQAVVDPCDPPPTHTQKIHFIKVVCDEWSDIEGNPSADQMDDTNGKYTQFGGTYNGSIVNPSEIPDEEDGCEKVDGWKFDLTTTVDGSYNQTGTITTVGPTVDGEFVTPVAGAGSALTAELQTGIRNGNFWVSEELKPGYDFATIRCYNDILNGDNLEFVNIGDSTSDVYCIAYNVAQGAIIKAQKIVCDDEALLPNWGTVDSSISVNENTAANFLSSTPERTAHCDLVDWDFQWGYGDSAAFGEGVDMTLGSKTGPADGTPSTTECPAPWCGTNTFSGAGYSQWKDFPSDVTNDGTTTVVVPVLDGVNTIWVREELKAGFVPFSAPVNGEALNSDNVSAEIYCQTDVFNYDNYDFITNPVAGQTYHCIAINATVEQAEDDTNIHFIKVVCDQFSDVAGNESGSAFDATNGAYTQFSNYNGGTFTPTPSQPVSPTEIVVGENGCARADGWQFKLSTDQAQGNDVLVTPATSGGANSEYATLVSTLPTNLKNAIVSGQLWVSEVTKPDTHNFAAIRCYNDAINGDNLEFITLGDATPDDIYCIAYNVVKPETQPLPCTLDPIDDVVSGDGTQFEGRTNVSPALLSNEINYPDGTDGAALPTANGAWTTISGAGWVNDTGTDPVEAGTNWRLYSHTFNIPAGATNISSPVLHYSADNSVTVFLDDVQVGVGQEGDGTAYQHVYDTAALTLTAGPHTLKFAVENLNIGEAPATNPTGLIYKLDTVTYLCSNPGGGGNGGGDNTSSGSSRRGGRVLGDNTDETPLVPQVLGDSTNVPSNPQVLGASDTLPRTGTPTWAIIILVLMAVPAFGFKSLAVRKS